MLRDLSIRNILLIDKLDLEFDAGLNVLTGETGAGKSILLDCLGLVLGWRGRADLVRFGADQGEVIANFELPSQHSALEVLENAGLAPSREIILRRTNSRDGRKTSFINDRRVSGDALRALSRVLIEVHGQHDDKGLLDQSSHIEALDRFADIDTREIAEDYHRWKKAAKALRDMEAEIEARSKDREYLLHVVEELDRFEPQIGEESSLDQRRRQIQASAKIRENIAKAAQVLGGDGADAHIRDATRWIEEVATEAEGLFDGVLKDLTQTSESLALASDGILRSLDALTFDPSEIERVEERLFTYRDLARKHNVQPDDLSETLRELRSKLSIIVKGADHIADLTREVEACKAAYLAAAEELRARRRTAARTLEEKMQEELAPLKMDKAEFKVSFSEQEPGARGIDAIAFHVATNPGTPPRPIEKIASGGELSRFLLALKVSMTMKDPAKILVFDEIDRGIGGSTADAVGRRLKSLSQPNQLLVVTHSPQVAAQGSAHLLVNKETIEDQTFSRVKMLQGSERVDEIARMLAGDILTDAAREAAKALLERIG